MKKIFKNLFKGCKDDGSTDKTAHDFGPLGPCPGAGLEVKI